MSNPAPWRSRIVGHGEAAPAALVPNERNWRIHSAGQQAALSGALAEVGWVAEVLVNQTSGHVIDGHLRIELALERGEPTVPVTYVELTEAEERLVLATLDPIGALAEASSERLAALLAELSVGDEALRALLADLAPWPARQGDPDAVLPDPEPTDVYVKAGELWVLGDHRLLCGDATNPADVARLLDGAEPTLLATDPPYGVSLDGSWRDGVYNGLGPAEPTYLQVEPEDATRTNVGRRGRNRTISGDTRVDWSEAFELVPSLQAGYVWHADRHAPEVAEGLRRIGFELVCQVIWDKEQFAMSRSWYHWGHEPCWVVRRAGVAVPFLGERNQTTVWRAPSPKMIMGGSEEAKQDHPTQKPVVLFETPILNHLRPGELVFDPFLGSGTTVIAAERLGRRCFGLEIEPRYAQVIIERWHGFTGREAVRVGA